MLAPTCGVASQVQSTGPNIPIHPVAIATVVTLGGETSTRIACLGHQAAARHCLATGDLDAIPERFELRTQPLAVFALDQQFAALARPAGAAVLLQRLE